MTDYRVAYRLGATRVRFSGDATVTVDPFVNGGALQREIADARADFAVVGDTRSELVAVVKTGWLMDRNISLTLSDDQRLVSASAETKGQAGKVLSGIVGTAAFVAGLAAVGPSPAIAAALGTALLGRLREATPGRLGAGITQPEGIEMIDPVHAAYRAEHPAEYEHALRYGELLRAARERILSLDEKVVDASGADLPGLLAMLYRVQSRLPAIETNVARLDAHFKAWRQARVRTWTDTIARDAYLDDLPVTQGGDLDLTDLGPAATSIWNSLQIMVVMHAEASPGSSAPAARKLRTEADGISYRLPRTVRWSLWKADRDGEPHRVQEGSGLAFDLKSEVTYTPFRRSWFGLRSEGAEFGEAGSLTEFKTGSASSVAAMADSVRSIPEELASGLPKARTADDALDALRSNAIDQELARLKKQLEFKQQELTMAGLAATSSDYAELERLKLQAATLDQRSRLMPESLERAIITEEADQAAAQKDLAEAQRQLMVEVELGQLRAEVEQLRSGLREHPGDATRGD